MFLDNGYNDDGAEVSVVLPTDLYGEVGGGLFRGDDTPFGGSSSGREAWSAYARVGGDVGRDAAWRIGGYVLNGKPRNRGGGHAHAHEEGGEHMHEEDGHDDEEHHEDVHHDDEEHHDEEHHDEHGHSAFFSDGMFSGTTRVYGIDFRSTWAPTGNARESELILQGELFWREEEGTYELETDEDEGVGETAHFDSTTLGWYAQAIYRFLPRWRVGVRYSRLHAPPEMELDHDPTALAAMIDWTNSEFGRLRLQYNRESLAEDEHDHQVFLQYVMSLGAHPAHTF